MTVWICGAAGASLALAFVLFNFLVLPRLDHYRPELERQLSRAIGREVSIASLSGQWDGLAPRLEMSGLSIADPRGAALTLDQVAVKPSWLSLLVLEPRLSLIELKSPSLDIWRSKNDQVYINGFPVGASAGGSAGKGNLANWLLRQPRIQVLDARIAWQDDYLGLPRLTLSQGQLELGNGLLGHSLTLSGRPPASVGTGVELSGNWHGDDTRDLSTWRGKLSASLQGAQVGPWREYLRSFGWFSTGEGDGSLSLSFANGQINSLLADVKVTNATYTLPGASALALPVMGGHLEIERGASGYQIDATHLTLLSKSGPVFDDSTISGRWDSSAQGGGEVRVDNVNLGPLSPILHALGIDRNPLLAHFAPSGHLRNLALNWSGSIEAPGAYRIATDFNQLAWQAFGAVPGVSGVSGNTVFDQNGGHLELDQAQSIQLPEVFPKSLNFSSLNARIDWRTGPQGVDVNFNTMKFGNADFNGWLSGHYLHHGSGAGSIDIQAGVDQLAATRVVDYLPYQAGHDTRTWLQQSLRAGTASQVRLRLAGDLDHFPFSHGQGGVFLVSAMVRDGQLRFDKDWPLLTGIDASLQFHNERMDIVSTRASTLGMPLSQVKVAIPDLGAGKQTVLQINGKVSAALQDMLAYTGKSPVDGWLSGLTGKARANGAASLDLGLSIPLAGSTPVRVKGLLHFNDNRLELTSLPLPALEMVNGELGFTEDGVSSKGLRFNAFGGPFTLKADSAAGGRMRFALDGEADSAKLFASYVPMLAPYVSGRSHYQAHFVLLHDLDFLQVDSDLIGSRIAAPAPLAKEASTAMAFGLLLQPSGRGNDSGRRLDFSLGSLLNGRARLNPHGALQAAVVAMGRGLGAMPSEGLALRLAMPRLDLQNWVDWALSAVPDSASIPDLPLRLELSTPDLSWGSYHLSNANLWVGHVPQDSSWHAMIDASEAKGEIDYSASANGMIRARLPLLVLDLPAYRSLSGKEFARMKINALPALDIRVGKLIYKGNNMGSLDIDARYVNQNWLLDPVRLQMPEGSFTGSLTVRSDDRVDARFAVETTDVGKVLERWGVPDSFRKGQGSMAGELSWPGALADFDPRRLSGKMNVDLSNGRFSKINPGVARLLGVISLQSLARRIRLDFTDVFSEGFAFDTLKGSALINQGIFKSDNVVMKGPGADVRIRGEVNLASESQQLQVHVEPHLSEGVALAAGAALINPVIGVAALAAQKVLQDPVSKIFAVDYSITGALTDPVVTKLGGAGNASAPSSTQMRNVHP